MVAVLLAALLASSAGAANVARVPARAVPALGAPAAGVSWSGGTFARPALDGAALSPSLPGARFGAHSTWNAPEVRIEKERMPDAMAVSGDLSTIVRAQTAEDKYARVEAPSRDYSREQSRDNSARAESVDNPEVAPIEGSARAAARAQERLNTPIAPSVEVEASSLSTLFDGSKPLPPGEVVVARARALGIEHRTLAEGIEGAESLDAALGALRQAGVLMEDERGEADRSRLMLLRVWHAVADAIPAEPLSVHAAGVAYHIHPVVHGQAVPLRSRSVRGLVARLKAAGAALLSEQDLGRFYGFAYGLETRDHEAAAGRPAELREQPARARRAFLWTALLGPLALLIWRLLYARLARAAAREGDGDLAHWLRARARALFSPRFDWAAVRRTELPAALTLEEGGWTAERSMSMAAAAASLAAARGLTELHLLVGHKHARQLAALLARGPRPRA